MLKVKTFVMNSGNQLHHERLDAAINNFIAENGIKEVVDIKYSTAMSGDADNFYCLLSAMLIYREDEINPKSAVNNENSSTYAEQCEENMKSLFTKNDNIDEIAEEVGKKLLEAEENRK